MALPPGERGAKTPSKEHDFPSQVAREINLFRSLEHPCIVAFRGVDTNENHAAVYMDKGVCSLKTMSGNDNV